MCWLEDVPNASLYNINSIGQDEIEMGRKKLLQKYKGGATYDDDDDDFLVDI